MECAHNGVAQVAEREEEAGQLSHSTQSADAIFSHVTNMLGNIIWKRAIETQFCSDAEQSTTHPAISILDTLASPSLC